jgi:hypothetical protein
MYPEDALRSAFLSYKKELTDLFGERAEIPTIEEFRFSFEDELVDTYYSDYSDEDED